MLVNIDKNDISPKVTKNNLVIAIIFANSWLPILTVVMIFVIWESVILIFGVPEYIAPTPSAVLETLVEERTLLFHNFLPTFFERMLWAPRNLPTFFERGLRATLRVAIS